MVFKKLLKTKILPASLSLALLCQTGYGVGAAATTLIEPGHWSAGIVSSLNKLGMFGDMGASFLKDGFDPDKPLTRGECAALLVSLQPKTLRSDALSPQAPFTDMNELSPEMKNAVTAAYNMKIFSGVQTPDGLKALGLNHITKEEMAALAGRMLDAKSQKPLTFADTKDISPWAYEYVAALADKGVVKGYDNKFNPKAQITRAEGASMIYAAINSGLVQVDAASRFAGRGNAGYSDGSKLDAMFFNPVGLALYKDSAILVADSENHMIRKITDGYVSTVSGFVNGVNDGINSSPGYYDGSSSQARIGLPNKMFYHDVSDKIFFTDSLNNTVRYIDRLGTVYTLSGSGKAGFTNGAGNQSTFNSPGGIAIDSKGNIYVCDTLNNSIRKITQSGATSTFAGSQAEGYRDGKLTEALFNQPFGIVIDKNDIMYITDSGNSKIRKISGDNVTTVAGGFNSPKGLTLSPGGVIYVADTGGYAIRSVSASGDVKTVAGGLLPGAGDESFQLRTQFNQPTDVLYADGALYVSDKYNNMIKKIKID